MNANLQNNEMERACMFKKYDFYKGRAIDENTKVFIYFNLRKKVFSVKALSGCHKGKVVLHLPSIAIKNAEFCVSEKGRQRVIREKQKNIHAGVKGFLMTEPNDSIDTCNTQVTYNPYYTANFVYKESKQPIFAAPLAYLTNKNVYVN